MSLEEEISLLKEALAEADFQRSKYKQLFDASADALSIIDLASGTFVECNDAAVKLHGVENERIFLNLTPAELSPAFQPNGKASVELSRDYIEKAVIEGPQIFQWQHTKLDGSSFPCLVSLTSVSVGSQNLILSTVRDISESENTKKELEAVSRQAESNALRMKLANDSAEIGVWEWDVVTNN